MQVKPFPLRIFDGKFDTKQKKVMVFFKIAEKNLV